MKKLLSAVLAVVMVFSAMAWSEVPVKAEVVKLSNPRIGEGMLAGQKATWDCVYFGSYPQAEVVTEDISRSVAYTTMKANFLDEGDMIIDDILYQTLESTDGWDSNGDIILSDGTKYRRMKKEDATHSYTSSICYQWTDSTSWHYFKYQPVKWRVLSVDGDDALLLSDKALDDQMYCVDVEWGDESVTWESSTIRSWLNGYGSGENIIGKDYSTANFISSAFTSAERNAIQDTKVENVDNIVFGTEGGADTIDQIFLLSESDVSTDAAKYHGFVSNQETYDEARQSKSSTYAKAMGTQSETEPSGRGNCYWWLRSPGSISEAAMIVYHTGLANNDGFYFGVSYTGVRPALTIDLSASGVYTRVGTVCSNGTVAEQENEQDIQNPRIVDLSPPMESKQKVTWDCVNFGSYPQAEVVTTEMSRNYLPLDSSFLTDGDLIVDDDLYRKLENTDEDQWDTNGDITLDGEKYRRIKQEDAASSYGSVSRYYWPGDIIYHYFQYEPVKWRVLSVDPDANRALLLSDKVLDDQRYHAEKEDVTWEASTIRSWLNGYPAEKNQDHVDYRGKNFIGSAFTSAQRDAIQDTTVENADSINWWVEGTEGGADTIDQIFLLSESEVFTDAAKNYGFVSQWDILDEARRSKSSTYAKAMGVFCDADTLGRGNCYWWLRSPGGFSYEAAVVSEMGYYAYGDDVESGNGIRPALYLDLTDSDLYTYAGTVCSDEVVVREELPDVEREFYKVTFDSSGGNTVEAQSILAGTKLRKPADPVKSGYTFEGWYAGNAKWDFVNHVVTSNTTLTAHWKKATEVNPPAGGQTSTTPSTENQNSHPQTNSQGTGNTQPVKTPKAGTKLTDTKTKAVYQVTKAGSAVAYTGTTNKKATTVSIPSTVKVNGVTYKVTSVAGSAFKNNKKLKKVTVSGNVTSIGAGAFQNCTALTTVKMGNKVTSIGNKAFYGCKKLSSVTIGSKVASVGTSAFQNCTALKKITIPANVKKIGSKAFYDCKKLISITVKTKKLTAKNVGSQAFTKAGSSNYKKLKVKVSKSKVFAYKKLFKKKGLSARVKVTK